MRKQDAKDIFVDLLTLSWRVGRQFVKKVPEQVQLFWPWVRWPLLLMVVFIGSCSGWYLGFPKTGRIVDASTGNGIPGAYVIATYKRAIRYYHGGDVICMASATVVTNQDGYYQLPYQIHRLLIPGGGYFWDFSVYKPGFVPLDGNTTQRTIRIDGVEANTYLWERSSTPPSLQFLYPWFTGIRITLSDVSLELDTLPINKSLEYGAHASVGGCSKEAPLYQQLKHELFQRSVMLICATNPLEEISTGAIRGIASAVIDQHAAWNFDAALPKPPPGVSEYPSLPAGVLCLKLQELIKGNLSWRI